MTEVELAWNTLLVHVRGMDQLWALKSRLEIPRSHVVGAEVDPEVAVGWKDLRVPGITYRGSSRRAASTWRASAYSGTCTTRRRPL
jgi:hypothetical protein